MLKIFFFIFLFFYHAEANDDNELFFHNESKKIEVLSFTTLDGSKYKLDDFSDKYLIINFWATWCPPCIKEIPDLLKLQKIFHKKLKIIFISVDSSPEKVITKFIKKNNFKKFDVFTDEDFSISRKLNVTKMPTSLIINKEGKEIARLSGYANWLKDSFIEKIKNL